MYYKSTSVCLFIFHNLCITDSFTCPKQKLNVFQTFDANYFLTREVSSNLWLIGHRRSMQYFQFLAAGVNITINFYWTFNRLGILKKQYRNFNNEKITSYLTYCLVNVANIITDYDHIPQDRGVLKMWHQLDFVKVSKQILNQFITDWVAVI